MARKKKVDIPPKGAPLWMVTYGDMITLVLCFFILLFAYSTMDFVKWKMVVSSLQGSIGVMPGGATLNQAEFVQEGSDPDSISENFLVSENIRDQQETQEMIEVIQQLRQELREEIEQGNILVLLDERGVVVRLQDSLLFDSGRATIKPEARLVLLDIANTIRGMDQYFRVEGHTDNVPTDPRIHPTNWELSADRATNVLRFLIESGGMDPFRMSLIGYGEFRPIAENTTPESRQRNRRVDILVLRSDFSNTEERSLFN